MTRVILDKVLFSDIVRKYQVSSNVIALNIHGFTVAECERKVFERSEKWSPYAGRVLM